MEHITGIQHVGIPTENIKQTIEFYKKIGFTVASETINPFSKKPVCFLKCNNFCIETYETDETNKSYGAIDHIALDVTDVDDVFKQISKLSFPIIDDCVHQLPFWQNGVRFFTIIGPNKEKIEFSQIL
jgi:catechol 2,3-dioxygenase-like lactoylglutathione lyase family enzyme